MVLFYCLITALLIVSGQVLWKSAVVELEQKNIELLSTAGLFELVTTYKLLAGMVVYLIATIAFIVLLSRFNYFQVQSVVVGSSLVMTLLAAMVMFGERPSILNVTGIIIIIIGSLLVITR